MMWTVEEHKASNKIAQGPESFFLRSNSNGGRQLNDEEPVNDNDCYERSEATTDYNEDLSIAPVSGLMFYVNAREKDLRLDALEIDIRWDLLTSTEESVTVQLYACKRCEDNVNFNDNGDFADGSLWDLVAEAPLIRHATNAERWLLPGYAFGSQQQQQPTPLVIPQRTRQALYLRATDTSAGTNRAILDVTNSPIVLSPHDIAYTLPNLQVLGGFGWTDIDANSDTAVFPSELPSTGSSSSSPPIFAGKLYLNAASTFCDFARTLDVAVEFRTVIDTSPRNGNANVTAAEGNIQTVQDFQVTEVQELLQKWATSVLQDDLDLFIWTQKHALVLDRDVQVDYSVYQEDNVACLIPEQCLGVVVKTFWKHTDELASGWIQAQLYKHTAVVLAIIHNQFPAEMPKFNVGLTGIQAELDVTLSPVDPANAVGTNVNGALVNQAQLAFLEHRLQQHWETTLPEYLENVYTVTLRESAMNGNQLRLSGYVQGSQNALEDRLNYATAIQTALNENAQAFWESVEFDMGLPPPLAGQVSSRETGLDMDQVALFQNVDTVSTLVESEFFGVAVRWVDGRGPSVESGESDGGGNFGIIVGVVVAALFVIVVLVCAARHLDKIQEKFFGKKKTFDDYDDDNTLSNDRFKDEGSRSRRPGDDGYSVQSSIRSEDMDRLDPRGSADAEEQAPRPRRRSKKYNKYWGGDDAEEVDADDGYDAQYDSRYDEDVMAKMPRRAPPTAVIVGGPMEEKDEYDIPRRAINVNTQVIRPETIRDDEKIRKSSSSKSSKKSKKSSSKDGEKSSSKDGEKSSAKDGEKSSSKDGEKSSSKDGEKKKSKKSKKSSDSKKSSSKKSVKEDGSE